MWVRSCSSDSSHSHQENHVIIVIVWVHLLGFSFSWLDWSITWLYRAAITVKRIGPSEEFELTWKLMASSFWGHSSSSQQTHKVSSHCEIAVSPLGVCNSHCEHAVSYSWDHPMSSPCSGSSELTVRVASSLKANCKHTVWAHLVSSLLAECPQNEPTMR